MKDKALGCCIEVYEQYTRAEVNNFHGSIIRCWKIGKRAMIFRKGMDTPDRRIKTRYDKDAGTETTPDTGCTCGKIPGSNWCEKCQGFFGGLRK